MTSSTVTVLTLRDGFTIKDPRGFNVAGGVIGRSLGWPLPPTSAGAVRTAVGTALGWLERPAQAGWPKLLEEVAVAGPLAVVRRLGLGCAAWQAMFPCPRDAAALPHASTATSPPAKASAGRLHWLAPVAPSTREEGVCSTWDNTPENRATEALWQPLLGDPSKPLPLPEWWSSGDAIRWLLDPAAARARGALPSAAWSPVARRDMHVAVDRARSTALPSFLYGLETREALTRCSEGVNPIVASPWVKGGEFDELGIWLKVRSRRRTVPNGAWRFGGESRWATATSQNSDAFEFPAAQYREVLSNGPVERLRLLLMTPAIFSAGWRPDPIRLVEGSLFRGCIAALPDVELTLRAAFVDRAKPVSGWDYVARGPKASRLHVGPGAVFYFEASRPLNLDDFEALWLATLQNSHSQEARDGFGLVVPGLWPASA